MSSPSFASLGVPADLVASLDARGITEPFPIQAAALPDALAGRDICGRAPTGSGKTIAFGIPLVTRVERAEPRRPRGLVLVPTRELAAQVVEELRALAGRGGPSIEAIYGGVGFDRQIKSLRRGVDIVVACPGRLIDLIEQRHVYLDRVDMVVIDEADRMADMGFLPVVRKLLDQCAAQRQTVLFSATLDGDVDQLITKYQHDPIRHETEGEEEDGSGADHHFWKVDKTLRLQTTASVVDRIGPTVVFCRTKRGADRIARQLEAAGVSAAAIHGDRSQAQRERALKSFHDGRVAALVATDVAARGIHVDGVAGVVHFDPPADHKDYVHRSGRTARAGAYGVVVSLVSPDLRSAVGTLQRQLGMPVGLDQVDLTLLVEGAPRTPRPEPVPDAARTNQSRPASRQSRPGDGPRRRRRPTDGPRREERRDGERANGARREGEARPASNDRPRGHASVRADGTTAARADARPQGRPGSSRPGSGRPDDGRPTGGRPAKRKATSSHRKGAPSPGAKAKRTARGTSGNGANGGRARRAG